MKKRVNNIYEKIISLENIINAYKKVREHKKNKNIVTNYHSDYITNLNNLHQKIVSGTWKPKKYFSFIHFENGKMRNIEAPFYEDRIIHHCIKNIIEPLYEKKFIFDSYSCRVGKGTHAACDRLQHFIRATTNKFKTPYVLKADISKFFPSVNRDILMQILSDTISDKKALKFIKLAIFPPDEDSNLGIPIGAVTSQICSNIYLNIFDHYIKDVLRIKYYIRYADDFIVIVNSKEKAKEILSLAEKFLNEKLELKLNPKTVIFPLHKGIDFCGFKIYEKYRRPRKRVVKVFNKKLRTVAKWLRQTIDKRVECGILDYAIAATGSFYGYIKHSSSAKRFSSRILLKGLISNRKLLLKDVFTEDVKNGKIKDVDDWANFLSSLREIISDTH